MQHPFTFARAQATLTYSARSLAHGFDCDTLVVEILMRSPNYAICVWREYMAKTRSMEISDDAYIRACIDEHAGLYDPNLRRMAVERGMREYYEVDGLPDFPNAVEVFKDNGMWYVATPYSTREVAESINDAILEPVLFEALQELCTRLYEALDRLLPCEEKTDEDCWDYWEDEDEERNIPGSVLDLICKDIFDVAYAIYDGFKEYPDDPLPETLGAIPQQDIEGFKLASDPSGKPQWIYNPDEYEF